MGMGKNLLKSALRGIYTRLMDRVGGKLVAGFTDTSSDAPDSRWAPKRDVYSQMVAEETGGKAAP